MIRRPETKEERHQYLMEELVNRRFKKLSPINALCWAIVLLLYAPIGFFLIGLRLSTVLIYLILSFTILTRKWRHTIGSKLLIPILGLNHHIKDSKDSKRMQVDKPFIMVCNHVSYFDSLMINFVFRNLGITDFALIASSLRGGEIQCKLIKHLGFIDQPIFTRGAKASQNQKEKTRDQILNLTGTQNDESRTLPIIVFPEGQVHSCNKFLLRYQKFCFGLNVPVLPLAARLHNPWPVNLWRIQEYPLMSTLWFLFVPWVRWDFKILPLAFIQENETAEAFATRIQVLTAKELDVDVSDFSLYDFSELL
jgi:1-acyl-sn-glycerol-3-phosphate acyltransferase